MTEYYTMTAADFETLKTTGIKVTFVKKNGEVRTMRCTTNLNNVPAEDHPKGLHTIAAANMHRAYDLDKNAWRTFNDNTVTSCVAL